MLGHQACSASENDPGKQRTEDGIADADPCGGKTEFPAELSCITDKNNCGKV